LTDENDEDTLWSAMVNPPTHPRLPLSYKHVIVLVSTVIAITVEGLLYVFGVFFEPLILEFGWGRAVTAGAFSLSGIVRLPILFFGGRLTDRFGSRVVLSACGLFLGSGYMLMSQVHALWQFYLFYGVLVGVGMGLYWVPLMTVVLKWFDHGRALAIGIVGSGIGVGQLLLPPVATWLISVHGWRLSCLILGGVCLGMVTLVAQFLGKNPKEKGAATPGGERPVEKEQAEPGDFSARIAVRSQQFWMFCGMFFPWLFCLAVVQVHLVIYATGTGMSPTNAASIIAVIGIAGIGGRLILSHLGDVIGLKPVLILCLALSSAAFVWLTTAQGGWVLYFFAAIFGIGYGAFEVLHAPVMAQLFGLASFGTIFGIAMTFSSLGSILGPVAAGYIFDTARSYQPVFLICIGMSLISLGCAILLPLDGDRKEPS
jgi:MFS transporter, OFA family, oxalate/formate antiporter